MFCLASFSYSAVISACVKDQQGQQALGLLAVMRQTGILPGAIYGSAVISACEKDQQWLQALGLRDLMQQTRALLGVISYSAGISACEKGPRSRSRLPLGPRSRSSLPPSVLVRSASDGSRCIGTCATW